jgi:hypothetical protein
MPHFLVYLFASAVALSLSPPFNFSRRKSFLNRSQKRIKAIRKPLKSNQKQNKKEPTITLVHTSLSQQSFSATKHFQTERARNCLAHINQTSIERTTLHHVSDLGTCS